MTLSQNAGYYYDSILMFDTQRVRNYLSKVRLKGGPSTQCCMCTDTNISVKLAFTHSVRAAVSNDVSRQRISRAYIVANINLS